MLTSHFTFQVKPHTFIGFLPVVENHLGEEDEVFLPDYPKNILFSKDQELVPWMVGLTSKDRGIYTQLYPNFSQAGETKLLYQKRLVDFCHLATPMFTITRRACHLNLS